jgi:hypothetical protein
MARAKIHERLAKLLALAGGSEGPEAESALAVAEKLADRHGIDLETIDPLGPSDAPQGVKVTPQNSALWRASLGWSVARYAGVSMVRHYKGRQWTVVGRPQDVELWRALFTRAEREIDAESRRYVASLPRWRSARSEGDTWRKGAASGFGERLAQWKKQSETAAQPTPEEKGTALVLVGRDALVKQKEAELFPNLSTISISAGGSSGAWGEGRKHGKGMGIHRGELG